MRLPRVPLASAIVPARWRDLTKSRPPRPWQGERDDGSASGILRGLCSTRASCESSQDPGVRAAFGKSRANHPYANMPARLSSPVRYSWASVAGKCPGAVDLTFDSVLPRVLQSNVKSKTTLETDIC